MRKHETSVVRAWHVLLDGGVNDNVEAHLCEIRGGCLLFRNHSPQNDDDTVLVRVFSRHAWRDCELVDTPASPPVHVPAAHAERGDLVGSRRR